MIKLNTQRTSPHQIHKRIIVFVIQHTLESGIIVLTARSCCHGCAATKLGMAVAERTAAADRTAGDVKNVSTNCAPPDTFVRAARDQAARHICCKDGIVITLISTLCTANHTPIIAIFSATASLININLGHTPRDQYPQLPSLLLQPPNFFLSQHDTIRNSLPMLGAISTL